ncbi:SEC-C metal-binding domain-containing protein, partial [Pseudoalteromonas sp. XMcav1-K]
EKAIMLQTLDQHWKDHLAAMDHLRQGIGLRGYAQKNPKQEYKRESFELFSDMLEALKVEVVSILAKVQVRAEEDVEAVEERRRQQAENTPKQYQHEEAEHVGGETPEGAAVTVRNDAKVGRNEPCPCGSGKKYKQCHGKLS